jgi:hypothetical protein
VKTVTLKQAQGRLDKLVNEVLSGKPVVLVSGRRRVLMRACGTRSQEREWAEFIDAFPSDEPEPRGAQGRIRRAIKRIRRNS